MSRILDAAKDFETHPCRDNLAALQGLIVEALDVCCAGCGIYDNLIPYTDLCPACYREATFRAAREEYAAEYQKAGLWSRLLRGEAE